MELLALVIFNIVLGFVFYILIKIKINETLKDFQTQKLKKEIQAQTLQFYKESENYLTLMDAKINALKNLLDRAEKIGIDFEKLEKTSDSLKPKKEDSTFAKLTLVNNTQPKEFQAIQVVKPENEGTFLAFVGKAFRSMLGVTESESSKFQEELKPSVPKVTPKNKIDVSIGGNPFEETSSIQKNQTTSEFYSLVTENSSTSPKINDQAKISIQAALKELPETSTKVEKVIFLLKKGYTHAEISEELGLALPEISLIETIHIEKSKRF